MKPKTSPHSRVYWEVMEDEKFAPVRVDLAAMGSWIVLLVTADMAYPNPAYIPAVVRPKYVKLLSEVGLIDVVGTAQYRVHGLEAERARRSASASQNAALRWGRPAIEGGRPASRRTRFKVLERDGYRCRYCGRTAEEVAIDVDHIVPVRDGGSDDLDNLVAACVDCNTGKSGHPVDTRPPE